MLVGHVGRSCWSTMLVDHVGRPCWSTMLVDHVGRPCWSTMLGDHVVGSPVRGIDFPQRILMIRVACHPVDIVLSNVYVPYEGHHLPATNQAVLDDAVRTARRAYGSQRLCYVWAGDMNAQLPRNILNRTGRWASREEGNPQPGRRYTALSGARLQPQMAKRLPSKSNLKLAFNCRPHHSTIPPKQPARAHRLPHKPSATPLQHHARPRRPT